LKIESEEVVFLKLCRIFTVLLFWWSLAGQAQEGSLSAAKSADIERFNSDGDFSLILPHVVESHPFYGLAAYYNGLTLYRVNADGVEALAPEQSVSLDGENWFVAVGRFRSLVLRTPGTTLITGDQTFSVSKDASLSLDARLVRNDELQSIAPALGQLRYAHLWWPIAQLARGVEWSLVELRGLSGLGWGMTIVLFTLVLKLLMVPLGFLTVRMQRQVSQHQGQLAPTLAEIKSTYDGEDAHKRIMAAHKALGVTPFFVLKPMLVMFIQIPVWIAVFNALGEMPQLEGMGFLWIESLAYPDAIGTLPFVIPLFGDSVSLLPLLMTAVTVVSALLFQDRLAPDEELKKQKRNGYLIALLFFVLFYPFPAAMVLYWTLSNALQIVQQRVIKV
jgi:YidC/Oxa1 family membrane protein insertase